MKTISVLISIFLASLVYSPLTQSQEKNVDENWHCPDVMVDCPDSGLAQNIRFKARIYQGVPIIQFRLKWHVSGGKITRGQGTDEITVRSKRHKGQPVTAWLEVLGIPKDCNNTASCRTVVSAP